MSQQSAALLGWRNMNKCKNCQWWRFEHLEGSYDNDIITPLDPDTYEPMQEVAEMRYCKSPKLLFWERPVESDGASLMDGCGYRAALITGADFGCVNFESRTEAA